MSFYYSDDPIRDYDRYDTYRERELKKRPRCSDCDNPIQDDYCYVINDEPICEDCLKSNYRKAVEDLIE